MRIGLVCPYSFDSHGGVQNHVLGLAAYLRGRGHQVHLLAPGTPETPLVGVAFTSAGATVPVRYNGSVARVNFGVRSAARVQRWLREHHFDLLHLHEPITPSIALLALWAATCPVVATFHTATPRSRSMHLAGGVLRASIDKIDAGIAVSDAAHRVVLQHLGRDPLIVPNGFDWHAFAAPTGPTASTRPRGRTRTGQNAPRLLFVGRVDEPRKGLSVLLEAWPSIRSQVPQAELLIAGQGSVALPPGCRHLGPVDDRTKASLLASADVFVAPHRDRESFGIVLVEAMAAGAPVVASALPAFAALLEAPPGSGAGRWGLTTPPGDPHALAAAVVETARRPDIARVRGAQERARRFDWSQVGPAITDVYHRVLDRTGPWPTSSTPARAGDARGAGALNDPERFLFEVDRSSELTWPGDRRTR